MNVILACTAFVASCVLGLVALFVIPSFGEAMAVLAVGTVLIGGLCTILSEDFR